MSSPLRRLAGDPALCAALEPLLRAPAQAGEALRVLRDQPGRRRLLRARLPDGTQVFLKHFAGARTRHRLREAAKRALGLDAGRREWRALRNLHARGVPVPEPLALLEPPGGGSVLAMRFLEGRTLAQALAGGTRPPGLLDALGDAVASLHAAGWTHRDLHHGNVLVTAGAVWLLDLQSALPFAGARARRRDLGALEHGLARWLPLAARVRLRARSLGLARPFSAQAREEVRAVGRAAETRARVYARSRTRRSRRPGRRYARLRADGRVGLRLRRIDEAAVLAALAAHESALAGGGPELLKHGAHGAVSGWSAGGLRGVTKEWRGRGALRIAADALRGSPAARAWRGGVGLRARRIGAAEPYAFVERRRFGLPLASWLLLEDLRPGVPADAAVTGLEPAQLADALAALAVRLHGAGIRHGDLKASHVYLAAAGPRLEARLIDLESVRFGRRVREGVRIHELAQLNASLPDSLPDAIRCRAFERYRAALPFAAPPGVCLRRIVAVSLARGHRWSGKDCALRPGS